MNSNPAAAAELKFGGATPIFRVRDLAASITYYVNALGFQLDWQGPGFFASVSRDRCTLFLCEGDQGNPGAWAGIGVGDVELLHAQFQAKGALIRQGPTNFSWAQEIQVTDPDGNVLRFGSDPLPDEPCGPWLDMRGIGWTVAGDGEWTRIESAEDEAGVVTGSAPGPATESS